MRRFWRDERGAGNPIELALVLPLFLSLLFGAYQVWEVIAVKESMDRAVLQAAEYWSTCVRERRDEPTQCKYTAEWLILAELNRNSLLRARAEQGQLTAQDIAVAYQHYFYNRAARAIQTGTPNPDPDRLPALELFTIEVRLSMPWAVEIPFIPSQRINLRAEHTAFKEKPFYQPPATPTATLTPTATATSTATATP